jgi:hypothetical protein
VIRRIILDLTLLVTIYSNVLYSGLYAPSSQVDIVEVQSLNRITLQAYGKNMNPKIQCSPSRVYQYYDLLGCDTV